MAVWEDLNDIEKRDVLTAIDYDLKGLEIPKDLVRNMTRRAKEVLIEMIKLGLPEKYR